MVMSPFHKELLRKSSYIGEYGVTLHYMQQTAFFLHWLHSLSFGTFCLALWLPERKSDSSDVFTS